VYERCLFKYRRQSVPPGVYKYSGRLVGFINAAKLNFIMLVIPRYKWEPVLLGTELNYNIAVCLQLL
jgi:hypothetical protein